MKKYLLILFIAINSLSVSAGQLNIVNSVLEKDYSYTIEHLNSDDTRSVVSTNFAIDEIIKLDSNLLNKETNPFFIRRSSGNKEKIQEVKVDIQASHFANSEGILQEFYPSVALYKNGENFADSTYLSVNSIGDDYNGLSFWISVPSTIHETAEDIGAFYLYYDYTLFEDIPIIAGTYSSEILIELTVD